MEQRKKRKEAKKNVSGETPIKSIKKENEKSCSYNYSHRGGHHKRITLRQLRFNVTQRV